jgi:C1A family cysteine protease
MSKYQYNLVPSPEDPRDLQFKPPFRLFAKALPSKVDLRPKLSPVVDQGALGSCTANALVSGCREYLLLNTPTKDSDRLSRLYVYFKEREAEGTVDEDAGAYIKDGCDVLLHEGVCRELLWPYNVGIFKKHPTPDCDTDAANYKITKYEKVLGIGNVKRVLADGYPLAAGMEVFSQMESVEAATSGIVRIPSIGEKPLGGHAVCVVGYVDTPRGKPGYWKGGGYLICRNSWSEKWGDKGYFYIAYDYVNLGHMYEFWRIS